MSFEQLHEFVQGEYQDISRVAQEHSGSGEVWLRDWNLVKLAGYNIELWSAFVGGTQLTEGTDYDLVKKDDGKTSLLGVNVWAGYQVTNATYQGVPLYLTARIIGGYTTRPYRPLYETVTGNYTVAAGRRDVVIYADTATALTITLANSEMKNDKVTVVATGTGMVTVNGTGYSTTISDEAIAVIWDGANFFGIGKQAPITTMTAGAGMIGGGTIDADRTFNVVGGDGITANANDIAVDVTVVRETLNVSAGTGLTGGGTLTSDITLNVGASDGIDVDSNSVSVDSSVARTSTSVIAGAGLTGGGSINASRTLDVGAGDGISVDADAVKLSGSYSGTFVADTVEDNSGRVYSPGNPQPSGIPGTVSSVSAGSGMSFPTITSSGPVAMGVPSTLTVSTANGVSTSSHSHALDLSGRTLTAGNGLTGGGTLGADRTFTMGTPGTIVEGSTNAVTATSHTHAITMSSFEVSDLSDVPAPAALEMLVRNSGNTAYEGRKITVSTSSPSGGADGDFWYEY